jgi:hypothetical protein
MATVNDVNVFSGSFVYGQATVIICIDPVPDEDLSGYTASLSYSTDGGMTSTTWTIGPITQIGAFDSKGNPYVPALIVAVTPVFGGFGGGFFFRLSRIFQFLFRRPGVFIPEAPAGTGTLSGTLNPPPGSPKSPKRFTIVGPPVSIGFQT